MKLAITCGDPAGVGPEIIEAWLMQHGEAAREVTLIGPGAWLQKLDTPAEKCTVGDASFAAAPGAPTEAGAQIAWEAMKRAAAGCARGEFAGVVTGPVSKEWLARVGYPFPGQTEFFAATWGGEPVMAFCGGKLRVVLATWHVPLHEVPRQLGPNLLRRTVAAAAELVAADRGGEADSLAGPLGYEAGRPLAHARSHERNPLAGARGCVPRIGVCGLNPHAGEGGLLGYEERDLIDPTLDHLRRDFPGLSRCQPGDTVFARALRGEFDVIVAMYHDQGLAPLKVIDFDEAVNVTLGLPFVRTSPDHGTAFGIAGKGVARASSFANAVDVARRLINWRAAR